MEAMQQAHAIRSDEGSLNTLPMCMRALVSVTLVIGTAVGSIFGAHAEEVKETPLVSCMIRKASPQIREVVAKAAQEDAYCPPPQLHPNQTPACPPEENNRVLIKRAVFDLAKECSKTFPIRESLPSIEEAFMASLHKDDAVKDSIAKRKAAYEKSKTDFERTRAGNTAVSK